MDPRTAAAQRSIWQPLTEAQFQQNISALWKITKGSPKDPQTYPLSTLATLKDEILPVAIELQLAEGIAFISARRKGIESVSAVVLEILQDPSNGLRLNLAANEEIHQTVKDGIDEVVSYLRQTARGETTRDQCRDNIFDSILQLNRARIHDRLRGKKSRYFVRDGLFIILNSLTTNSQSGDCSILAKRLQTLCNFMRGYCNGPERLKTLEDVKCLVTACYDFFRVTTNGQSVKDMLRQIGIDVDNSRGNPHLRQIGKIANYCHISETLSIIATHREFRRFCVNLSIRYVPAYKTVQLSIPAVDRGSRDCRVHAEVQLVVDLDLREPSNWKKPRVIGSSKAPCFLCELFINEHGGYFVHRSHGKLTPRWTVPNLNQFGQRQVHQYRNIIGAMNGKLQRLVKVSHPRRVEAAMSWQAFSQLNAVLYSEPSAIHGNSQSQFVQVVSADRGPPEPANDGLTSVSLRLPEPALPALSSEVKGVAHQPQSDSTIIPIKSLVGGPSGTEMISGERSQDLPWQTDALGAKRGISHSLSELLLSTRPVRE